MPLTEPISLRDYIISESSDFEYANDEGAVEVPPGEAVPLVEFEPGTQAERIYIHAVGATDALDVEYRLQYGQDVAFSTESPLGSVNEPFSFPNQVGRPLTTTSTAQYVALNRGDQERELVARMHVEIRD